jgi:agmatinase
MGNDGFTYYPFSFAGLSGDFSDYDKSYFIIVPVPYDATTSYMAGARRGPFAIIDSSIQLELFDDELQTENYKLGIHTAHALEPMIHPEKMISALQGYVKQLLADKKFPVILGGDHSISYAPVSAFKEAGEDFTVVHLDAHADLRMEYQGTAFSHACVMRRISELNLPVVQTGIRSLSREEWDYINTGRGLKTFFARDLLGAYNFTHIIDAIKTQKVYLTIDVDVFDPSVIPATGTPEPGGLSWYQIISLIKELVSRKELIGMDVVELAPNLPSHSEFTIAKLIYKTIGYITNKGGQ